jgi:hypothetical protein
MRARAQFATLGGGVFGLHACKLLVDFLPILNLEQLQ